MLSKTEVKPQVKSINSNFSRTQSPLTLHLSKIPKIREVFKKRVKSPEFKSAEIRSKSLLRQQNNQSLIKFDTRALKQSKRHNRSSSSIESQNKTFENQVVDSKKAILNQSIDSFKFPFHENLESNNLENSVKNHDKFVNNQNIEKNYNLSKECFNKLLEKNNDLSSTLSKIKDAYENYIENLKQSNSDKLIEENNRLKSELGLANKKIKDAEIREKKYLKLLATLEKKGYPVEETYKNHKKPPKKALLSTDEASLNSTDYSEVSSLKRDAPIPRLSLPQASNEGYHQEFMSHLNEFSESWRLQMEKDKR